ncbi:MAG: ATP synthase subunit I [Leptothrix sp. (in: b-proteobacteria)]
MSDLRSMDAGTQDDAEQEAPIRALTAEEVAALRLRQPTLSIWQVVRWQAGVGLLVVIAMAAVVGSHAVISAAYGVAAVLVPTSLLARGMSRSRGAGSNAIAFSFVLWEFVKLGVSVAMLVAAPWLVRDLSWPVLLVSLVVCMKVNWLALLWQGRTKTTRP